MHGPDYKLCYQNFNVVSLVALPIDSAIFLSVYHHEYSCIVCIVAHVMECTNNLTEYAISVIECTDGVTKRTVSVPECAVNVPE